jgi:hypothetical protein
VRRQVTKVQMGQRKVMETVRVESDPTFGPDDGQQGFQALWYFIQSLQTNPTLLRHSVDCPGSLRFAYNGTSWVVETQTLVDAPPDAT